MLWTCRRCTTRFAVGLPYCPQCTSTDIEKEDGVPKTTVHGGPSNAGEAAESPREAVSPATALSAAEPESEAEAKGYAASTVEELREVLRLRKLPISGTKAELVARLEADDDDAADAAAEAGE